MSMVLTKTEAAHGPSHVNQMPTIHPLAFVDYDSGVHLGWRTRVWQFASVVRGAVLGADCSVASGVTVDGCTFGDGCVISQGVTTCPGILFGNDVFLGPNASFCNDRWPRASKIGFDAEVFAGDCYAVVVADGASIGARAVVLPGISIGHKAMIAAGAVVDRCVPSHHLFTRDGRIVPIRSQQCLPRIKLARR